MRYPAPITFVKIVAMLCFYNSACAQFAPAKGLTGSTAIWKDSSVFADWATGCVIQRGPMNIANPSLGPASAGDSSSVIGMAGQNGSVSLGDGGIATLTFNRPVFNGDGFDFAVFENGFMTNDSNMAFLELAFVEVSTDGIRFVRFPAVTNVEDSLQTAPFGATDCAQLYNFAGKYVANYGTPFDLNELVDSAGIDINNINYIRIVDVVGSLDSAYATYDHNGHKVNDPWPTAFPSGGFDLDAVGIIHSKYAADIKDIAEGAVKTYPNPVHQGDAFNIQLPENTEHIRLFDISGQILREWPGFESAAQKTISTANLGSGIYFITVETAIARFNTKLVVE